MARVEYKEYSQIGNGFRIITQSIPPAGLIPVLRAARQGNQNLFRYSVDGGKTFTDWESLTPQVMSDLGSFTDRADLVVDYVTDPFRKRTLFRSRTINLYDQPLSNIIYDKSVFKIFFDNNDPEVLGWAINVLEKLFEPGIVPLYVSRNNEDDFNTYFLTIAHFFAFIVVYARRFRKIDKSDLLLKTFIEGWGLVYENLVIKDQTDRTNLFKNWINQFYKRGTYQIVETGGDVEGELRRLVGYYKPNEFIFGVLAPQNVGWCIGWSSPTWYGTETINAVSKGYDFGPDYAGDNFGDKVHFGEEEITLSTKGDNVKNDIITNYPWEIFVGDDPNIPPDLLQATLIGVGKLSDYPILGEVKRKYQDGMYVLSPVGSGRCGISSEADLSKVIEVYVGLDYEVTVWLKADNEGVQNIEFGVNCYDGNMKFIKQIRITDFKETNSFFTGERYQNPCKVPGIYYRLKGIIYNVTENDRLSGESEEDYQKRLNELRLLYLNFENGRPLRFIGDVKYMAPYIVQNREGNVADISIAGIVLKPLDLPFSQGYLGQKNVIAMYAQIKSARTKKDIEEFIQRYLVSYKNVVSYTWLDWVVRTAWFLTFNVTDETTGEKLSGATVTLSNGFSSVTDEDGYVRFEVKFDTVVNWTVDYKGVKKTGTVTMNKDQDISVSILLPLFVDMQIVEKGFGTVKITGTRWGDGWLPRTEVTFDATPAPGYVFIKYVIVTDKTEDTRNPTNYFLGDHNIVVQAIFEVSGELSFEPAEITIPATGGIGKVIASSTKHWVLDSLPADWASVTPAQGDPGDTELRIEIDQEG